MYHRVHLPWLRLRHDDLYWRVFPQFTRNFVKMVIGSPLLCMEGKRRVTQFIQSSFVQLLVQLFQDVHSSHEEYIVKDHWVKGNSDAILNEVKMLEEVKGVAGVPRLVGYWLVQAEEGHPDETQRYRNKIENSTVGAYRTHIRLVLKPRARPLYMFRSKKELLRVLRDIVLIQQCAVETHQILHRDCSLNNIMIEDCEGGSRGSLIDWEFASRITSDNTYPTGGTG
ncbi:uncharacterized protein F5891DRAFT_989795 [Suillus fuscotomentosus]|uniref:Fungal-type protein kinase domain-containing protein n=1 Tax=Suillus fuscotomentosus TaxID=1912939 RepID=A0AAD4DQ52_9AGAM|nr:uncharacterized protein F5891DRAFT_989795 [Suillus fuscotomentosus]KAG1885293.1 hypothetical protein F5891DRAFT_989795 [Suillus fuscotomentosus]